MILLYKYSLSKLSLNKSNKIHIANSFLSVHFINSFLAQFSIGDRLLAIISNVNVNLGLAATLRVRAEVVPVASRRLLSLTDATTPLSAPPLSLTVCLSALCCLREVALNARCDMRDALSASIGNFRVICKQSL